jgi:hypothetical protein
MSGESRRGFLKAGAAGLAGYWAMTQTARAQASPNILHLTGRRREGEKVINEPLTLYASQTALVICDMWDKHWCKSATRRVGELGPHVNELANALRA